MTEDFLRAYKSTIDFWAEDLKVRPLVSPDVKEVSEPGVVMQDENVKSKRCHCSAPSGTAGVGVPVRFP
jgi:hypothetical protein